MGNILTTSFVSIAILNGFTPVSNHIYPLLSLASTGIAYVISTRLLKNDPNIPREIVGDIALFSSGLTMAVLGLTGYYILLSSIEQPIYS